MRPAGHRALGLWKRDHFDGVEASPRQEAISDLAPPTTSSAQSPPPQPPGRRPRSSGVRWHGVVAFVVVGGIGAAIVGVALLMLSWRFVGGSEDVVYQRLMSLGAAIDLYTLENHELPASLDVLTRPSGKSNEPYLKSIPLDPWNRAVAYHVLDAAAHVYRITCAGEDGRYGTDDDVVYPGPRDQR